MSEQNDIKKLQEDFDKLKAELELHKQSTPIYPIANPICPYHNFYNYPVYNPCLGCSNYGTGKPCWCIKGSQVIY